MRKGWSCATELEQYSRLLHTLTEFTDMVVWPGVRRLDFGLVPRTLR